MPQWGCSGVGYGLVIKERPKIGAGGSWAKGLWVLLSDCLPAAATAAQEATLQSSGTL